MVSKLELANAIRFLAMDAVQRAKSGHPGMPMGMADIAEVLWNEFLKHNPTNPHWLNRDRFILSNGHGSMLQYALLHLTGYALSIDDIKAFRQLHSITPGHPEYGETPGVETTTGPLGQGLGNAVGMAIAEAHLRAVFNKEGFPLIDHYTYVFVGDGCLMEGISHEVASLAGTLRLGKLIAFYDDNEVSIDGHVQAWFTDNTPKRFEAYGWHVIRNIDGHNPQAIKSAIIEARANPNQPSLLCCKTIIGYGAPHLAGSHKTHGAPLGDDEIAKTREKLKWSHLPFVIPKEIYQAWDKKEQGMAWEREWNLLLDKYSKAHPESYHEFKRRCLDEALPLEWNDMIQSLLKNIHSNPKNMATRQASLLCLNAIAPKLPELIGGSADLTESNLTKWQDAKDFNQSPEGRYIYYGVREFGMSSILNGMALHHGIIPFGGTFLVFLDYARNAVRLSSLMKRRVIFVYTHDSIGLGEDGPTHQPIEHMTTLRITPNMTTWRPCDAIECIIAWKNAIERKNGPTALLLSRQSLPQQKRSENTIANIDKGGYTLISMPSPKAIIIATGSEVSLAVLAHEKLLKMNIPVNVISMPSPDTFEKQSIVYQNETLLPNLPYLFVEAGSPHYWYKFANDRSKVLGLERFGASAPGADVFKDCEITDDKIVEIILTMLKTHH